MPTAAKFVAAVCFGIVGLLASIAYIPLLPEGENTNFGYFREITAALGLLIGWIAVGRNVGKGYASAFSLGLRGSALLTLWALLGFSIQIMIRRSTKMLYDDAGEAALAVPQLMVQYARPMLDANFLITLAVGGIIGGLLAEFASHRWS